MDRDDLEIAWREMRFLDPQERREACSRLCIARWGRVQALITAEFWAETAARWSKVCTSNPRDPRSEQEKHRPGRAPER